MNRVDKGRELWKKATDEHGLDTMNSLIRKEREKCEISRFNDKVSRNKYLIVKIEIDGPNQIEEMARLANNDPGEILNALEMRAARLSVLINLGYVKADG